MEYFQVTVPGREGDDIDVLIDGERKGKAGEIIILAGSCIVAVSVDRIGAEERTVEITNTSAMHPMVIEIRA